MYREIIKNLESCWIAAIITFPFVIYHLFSLLGKGLSIVNLIILLFLSLIFIQSVRGIIVLSSLKKQILISPESVRLTQVFNAPSIRRFIWFVD